MYRFYHVLRFIHCSGNKNEPDETDENYDQLWKMRAVLDKLINSYAKYYGLTEHLAVDEIIVPFKGSHFHIVYTKETQAVWDKALQAM